MKRVTCCDDVGRWELTLGEHYEVVYVDGEQALVWLAGFENPFSFSRFEELL